MKVTKNQKTFKEVTIAVKCDSCSNIIDGKYIPESWMEINLYEIGYGDSDDESYHLCSPNCFSSFIKTINLNDSYTYRMDIEITDEFIKNLKECFKKEE